MSRSRASALTLTWRTSALTLLPCRAVPRRGGRLTSGLPLAPCEALLGAVDDRDCEVRTLDIERCGLLARHDAARPALCQLHRTAAEDLQRSQAVCGRGVKSAWADIGDKERGECCCGADEARDDARAHEHNNEGCKMPKLKKEGLRPPQRRRWGSNLSRHGCGWMCRCVCRCRCANMCKRSYRPDSVRMHRRMSGQTSRFSRIRVKGTHTHTCTNM